MQSEKANQLRSFSRIRHTGVGNNLPSPVQPLHHNEIISLYQPAIVHAHGDEIKLMWRVRALIYETVPQTEVEFYIPGNFIPASLRAKLALPICLNILRICAYWRSRLFTSCTLVPDPRAMRFRRLPLMTSW